MAHGAVDARVHDRGTLSLHGDGLVDGDRRLSRPSGVEDRVDDGIGRPLSRRA